MTAATGLALAASLLVWPASAGNPNRAPMTLTSSEYEDNFDILNGQPNGWIGCQDEDDKDRRWYSGWLAPGESFSPEPVIFCDPTINGGYGSGNTGAWMEVMGDTRYLVDWRMGTTLLVPTLVDSNLKGKPHELWKGCEATVKGPVYLTITNIGSRGASTVLGFGSRWHDTFGTFHYDCS